MFEIFCVQLKFVNQFRVKHKIIKSKFPFAVLVIESCQKRHSHYRIEVLKMILINSLFKFHFVALYFFSILLILSVKEN